MSYYRQFDNFDPLKGPFLNWTFPQGSSVVYRARSLLHGRTLKEIKTIAEHLDEIISSFFASEKACFISQLEDERRRNHFDEDMEPIADILERAAENYELRTPSNMSDFEALQEAMGQFFHLSDLEINNPHEYEYFAVMALGLVGSFIEKTETELDLSSMRRVKCQQKRLDAAGAASAARCLIDAMEAVCYAERLREIERTQERYEQQIQKIQSSHKLITTEDQARIRAEARQEFEAEAKARRVAQAKENGKLAHRESYEAKDLVLEMWEKNPTQFRSAEKAGAHYVDVLLKRGIEREHRTVVGWIRARAKELGIRFR